MKHFVTSKNLISALIICIIFISFFFFKKSWFVTRETEVLDAKEKKAQEPYDNWGDFAIGPGSSDFSVELCEDYHLHRSSSSAIDIWDNKGPVIPTIVVELGYNRKFIIAKQNRLKRRSPDNPEDTYMIPAPGIFSYWIVDVSIPKTYGPLTLAEFKKKRIQLNIPSDLMMQDVYKYRK